MTDAWDDEGLLTMLREALRSRQAVPAEFVVAGKNAFAWRNIDSELASLTYDSTHGPDLVASTRSESASIRGLTFTSPRLTIELEVTSDSVLGQVIPPQVITVEVQTQVASHSVQDSDEIGCFVISPKPTAPFRLRCRNEAGIDVLTSWITL